MESTGPDDLASILDAARAEVAAGRDPDEKALEARIRKAGGGAKALEQLERVLTVQRARARLAAPPTPPSAAPSPPPVRPTRPDAFRAQPTITGNMEVRRSRADAASCSVGTAHPAVTGWEVRFSERADARSEYVVRETLNLPGNAMSVELALGELPRRVHLLGRAERRTGSSAARSSPRSRRTTGTTAGSGARALVELVADQREDLVPREPVTAVQERQLDHEVDPDDRGRPSCSTSPAIASTVPPVARTSSWITTRAPSAIVCAFTSSAFSPYSSA